MLSDHQSFRLRLKPWGIGFIAALGLLIVHALFGATPALAVGIVVTDPITNEVGVDPDADIVATYTAAISPTTVTTRTFVAQGMMSGRRDGTFSFGGGDTVVTLDPDEDYFAGEVVRVSATGGISDALGSPVTPYQWQFTAGPLLDQCAVSFSNQTLAGPSGVTDSSAAWGDYDKDGDLDFLLTGWAPGRPVSELWRNDGNGVFSDQTPAGLPAVSAGSLAWGDYDNDGNLDFLLTGADSGNTATSQLWHNEGDGTFSNQTSSAFPGGGVAGVGQFSRLGRLRQRRQPGLSADGIYWQ